MQIKNVFDIPYNILSLLAYNFTYRMYNTQTLIYNYVFNFIIIIPTGKHDDITSGQVHQGGGGEVGGWSDRHDEESSP